MQIFDKPSDYNAFERVMVEAAGHVHMRVLAYCLMPNHWHMVLWARADGAQSPFMEWLMLAHTRRYRVARGQVTSNNVANNTLLVLDLWGAA
jgi:putative transposase